MEKVITRENLYIIDLQRRKLKLHNITTHINKYSMETNPYYISYYNYYHGWYRVYTVFQRYDDGRTTIDNMASYDYEDWKNILQNHKGKYATYGLVEIQIIKPKIFTIDCPY